MFDAQKVHKELVDWIKDWFEKNGPDSPAVIGISGGKDSTVSAALLVEALGKDRVIGVLMPDEEQPDIEDSYAVCKALGIKYYTIDISNITFAFTLNTMKALDKTSNALTEQMQQNLPPRVRMTTLYAISQNMNGRVCNTSNYSEIMLGWGTRWGDMVGDFAPLADLTATEVIEVGKTFDNIPQPLILKKPSDGLCGKTDEDVFEFTYNELDTYLRTNNLDNENSLRKIKDRIRNSAFKRSPIPSYKIC